MKFFIALSTLLAVAASKPSYSHGPAHGYHGPPAPLAHDGRVVDTPEVAHVKAAHLATHAAAASKAGNGHDYAYDYAAPEAYIAKIAPVEHSYHGPPAPLAHDGNVVDTAEVAHAKAAHFAAHAAAHYGAPALEEHAYGYAHAPAEYGSAVEGGSGYGYAHAPAQYGSAVEGGNGYGYAHAPAQAYHGPAAPLAHDGTVIDTPEVAHAKAAHLATHAHAAGAGHARFGGYGHAAAYKW